MQAVLDGVLKRVKPSRKEEEKINRFVSHILRVSKTVSGLDTTVVGSIGKGTWLSGDHDIDVFLIFPKNTTREELQEKGLDYGRRIVEELKGKSRVKYAEHPYTNAKIKGFDVDIVPCFRIQKGEHIVSAVDRSPLHLQYILDHMSPKMKDEVRLLKQFCKGVGVYGSDAKHLGFSGYICELLILYYQTFEATLRAASAWQAQQIVELLGFTDKSKFPNQPLIIIDPVDHQRNAAAVVGAENFMKFIAASKQFVAKPNVSMFWPAPPTPLNDKQAKYLMNRGTRFVAIKMKAPDVIEDVLYPQLRKALNRMKNLLHHSEFSVLRDYEFATDTEAFLIFELEIFELPPVNNQEGPPVFAKHHTLDFLAKYKGKNFIYVDDDRLVAEVKRECKTALQLLEKFIRREKDKLVAEGVPTYIADVISQGKLLDHGELFTFARQNKELSSFLRERYFVDIGKML